MTDGHFAKQPKEGEDMPTKEEKKLIKRTKIIDAAYELFTKNGIDVTPIDEVVKKAGVAKGTFYLYFRDKYDLTDQIVLHECSLIVKQSIEETEKETFEKNVNPVDKIMLFADKIIDRMIENRDIIVLLNSKLSGLFGLLVSDGNPEIKQSIEKIMDVFSDLGYEREEARMHLYLVSNMMTTVCCEAVLGIGPYTIDEIRPEISRMLVNLLAQPKQKKEKAK